MSLAEAVETYAGQEIGRGLFGSDEVEVWDEGRLAEVRERVAERIAEIEEMKGIMAETVELLEEMVGLVDDQSALAEKMVRVDELRAMVKERGAVYRLITYVSQDAELYRFRQDRQVGVEGVEGKARQRRELQRDVGYVRGLIRGCERLEKMLRETEGRL